MIEIFSNQVPERDLQENVIGQAAQAACRRLSNIVVGKNLPTHILGSNIFLGVGLITGSNRISKGLGLGFINMACLAREAQKQLIHSGESSEIVVLIADTHALGQLERSSEIDELKQASEKAAFVTSQLFHFLGTDKSTIKVIQGSDPLWPTMQSNDYTNMEINDILLAHQTLDCGLKIGWQSKRVALNGTKPFDELFFDQEAISQHPDVLSTMGFLYGPEWISLQTQTANENNLPLPPYFGDDDKFVLGSPIDFKDLSQQKVFTKQMKKMLSTTEGTIKLTLDNQGRSDGYSFLQQLADFCRT